MAMRPEHLKIGELAKAAAVEITTIRFYERKGLLAAPPRRASGYRMYPPSAVRRLQFIQAAKKLGFSLAEIADLLALRAQTTRRCEQVRSQAEDKIADIDCRIRELERFRRGLQTLAEQCRAGGTHGECPLLEALENAGSGRPAG